MHSWARPLRAQHASLSSRPLGCINELGWGPRKARPLLQQLSALSALELMGQWARVRGRRDRTRKGHGAGAFLRTKRSAGFGRWAGREHWARVRVRAGHLRVP